MWVTVQLFVSNVSYTYKWELSRLPSSACRFSARIAKYDSIRRMYSQQGVGDGESGVGSNWLCKFHWLSRSSEYG